jgi:hypothetical protein
MIADGEDFAERREMDGAFFLLAKRRCVLSVDLRETRSVCFG